MALGTCWLPKESSQFDETIENCVVRRNVYDLVPGGDPIASHPTFGLLLTLVSTILQHTSVRYGPGEQ